MRSLSPAEAAFTQVRRARPLLGTVVEIDVIARAPDSHLHASIDAAFSIIERVHHLMSYQDPDSELSCINRDAHKQTQRVDGHTFRVLQAALHFARLSDGVFDPCVGRHLEDWGYLPRRSLPQENVGSWRDIELIDGHGVRYLRALSVDLGGIAKGYAVDLAVRKLQELEIPNIIVNAGGDLRVAGDIPRSIHLRHPGAPERLARELPLKNAAVATSAAYFSRRSMQGRELSALIDPRDGKAYLGNRSISVRASDCMSADALTKVVLFAERSVAARCLALSDAQTYVLAADAAN